MDAQVRTMASASNAALGYSAATKATATAQTAAMSSWTAQRAVVTQVDEILGKSALTSADVARADALLDKAQQSGAISAGELAAAFKVLDEAKIKDIATTEAQVVAAKGMNSRFYAELGTGLSEAMSGNIGRLRRTGASALNQSGFFAAMFTPTGAAVTALTATLGALGIAYANGQSEADALNKAIIATGGASGVTYGQVKQLATGMVDAQTSAGSAAKTIMSLATSGQFAGPALQDAARAAQGMAELLGASTEEAASKIEAIGRDPAKALADLNNQLHFLTVPEATEIANLERMGKTSQAAALGVQALAKAEQDRLRNAASTQGWIGQWWSSLTGGLHSIGSGLMGIGAPKTAQDQLSDVQTQLEGGLSGLAPQASAALFKAMYSNGGRDDFVPPNLGTGPGDTTPSEMRAINALLAQRRTLMAQINAESDKASASAAQAQSTASQVSKILGGAQKSATGGGSSSPHSALDTMLAGMQSQVAGITAGGGPAGDFVATATKATQAYQKDRAAGIGDAKAQADFDQIITLANQKMHQEITARQQQEQGIAAQYALQLQLKQQQYDLQVRAVGIGDKEAQREQSILQIQQQGAQDVQRLQQQKNQRGADIQGIDEEIAQRNQLTQQ